MHFFHFFDVCRESHKQKERKKKWGETNKKKTSFFLGFWLVPACAQHAPHAHRGTDGGRGEEKTYKPISRREEGEKIQHNPKQLKLSLSSSKQTTPEREREREERETVGKTKTITYDATINIVPHATKNKKKPLLDERDEEHEKIHTHNRQKKWYPPRDDRPRRMYVTKHRLMHSFIHSSWRVFRFPSHLT